MSLSQKKGEDLIIEKKNSIIQLWYSLKTSIFNVLFVVLDKTSNDESESIGGIVWESGIDYGQMMAFPFNFTILMVWNGGETLNNIFSFMTNAIQINNLFPALNYNAYLVFLYFLNFLVLMIVVDIIYVGYSFSKKKFRFTWPLVILVRVVPLCVTIFFITITELLLNIINCNASVDNPDIQVLQYFPNVICFEGTHIIHVSITMFFTATFVFVCTIIAAALFEPRMTSGKLMARKSSKGEIIFIINKIICQFFFSFTPFSDTWVYIVLMFFPALWLFSYYHYEQPYYSRKVNKLFRIFSAYYFWTVGMQSMSQLLLLLDFNFQGSLVIWFCGLPFIGFSIAFENKSNIDNLFSSNLKFKTGQQLEQHLIYVLQLIYDRKNDENSNMLLVGYIQKHIETCVEDDCPIKIKKPKKEQILSQMDQNCKLLIIQLERMYKQGIKKFPNCTKLHISFAFFYLQKLKLNAKAYEEFIAAEKATPSFIEQFIIYRFKKIIKQKLEENKDEDSDLIQIIRFDNHISLCQEAMIRSAKLHKEFWSELLEQTPVLIKLNQNGARIIEEVENVKKNYIEVHKINSHSPQIIFNYGLYSMFISQNISEGKKALSQSKRAFYEKKNKDAMISTKTNQFANSWSGSSMTISASQDSMGKILAVSERFIELSGFMKEQITEKSIQKILPHIMMFYHEFSMNAWLKDQKRVYMNNPENKYFNNTHEGFIKQKNGFIIPVLYKVSYNIFQQKFYVYFQNEPQFNDHFEFKIFIIANEKGIIKDISSLGFTYFNLSKDNIMQTDRYVDEFGIPFSNNLYEQDGFQLKLTKIAKENTIKDKISEKQNDIQQDHTDDFIVTAKKIWMLAEQEDEEGISNKLQNGKKHIGSIIILQKLNKWKAQNKQVQMIQLNNFSQDILNFYGIDEQNQINDDNGESYSDLRYSKVADLNSIIHEIKMADEEGRKQKIFLKYGQKIKTYRYYNKQFKRIFDDFEESQQLEQQINQQNQGLSTLDRYKLKNPLFVQKIKNAINTNIDHKEVSILKIAFTLFIIGLGLFSIINYIIACGELDKISNYSQLNMSWMEDSFYLNNLMHLSFLKEDQPENLTLLNYGADYSKNYSLTFNPSIVVNIIGETGNVTTYRLIEGMAWLQGNYLNYFTQDTLIKDLHLVYLNFYNSILPVIQSYSQQFNWNLYEILICFIFGFGICILMMIIWVIHIMRIDQRCFDIILWFLDIPISYVNYLALNCNNFIKNYCKVKQLIDKGINFHDKNLFLEIFESEIQVDDLGYNEQNKARKILIARHKKKIFWSKCNISYIQILWVLVYGCIPFISFLIILNSEVTFFRFLNQQWGILNRSMIWSSTMPNNLRLINKNQTKFGSIDIVFLQKQIENKFLNPVSQFDLSESLEQLISSSIYPPYKQNFIGDICEFQRYSEEESVQCKNQLGARLEGGLNSLFTYYSHPNHGLSSEIQRAQYNYAVIYLKQIFDSWKNVEDARLVSANSNILIVLILFLVSIAVTFVFLLFLYLQKLNIRLNQTIKMLNMIPINMLPNSRKDIRDFFAWLIKEANKNNKKQNT